MTALVGASVLAGDAWLTEHAIIVAGGVIKAIVATADVPSECSVNRLHGGMLIPGFIDTQVNGGGGVLFNDTPTVAVIEAIARAHRAFGTTALLPTLISDDLDVIATAISAVDEAIDAGVPGVIGIHIEGPFLNAGKRGIHDASKFRTLDDGAVALLSSLKHGKTLVTLAPELSPPGAIRALVERGVIVAAGHTLATYEDMVRAVDEGLSGVTHLFNAMTPLDSRAPGVVGAAFDLDLTCGIIVDGHHVHPATLRAAYHVKGAAGLMLVTDAMPTVGSDLAAFTLGNAVITAQDDTLRSADGTLAGSQLDMASAVRNAVSMMQIDLASASEMASVTPAAFLGLSARYGRLAPGLSADIVHLADDCDVRAVWIAGKPFIG
ncbi:MAG: N-acetylglucosamine-6-phosphate deacetylase [Sphingomonadaceae bacterium]